MNDSRTTVTFAELIRENVLEIGDGYRAKSEELGGAGPIFLRGGLIQDDGIHFDKGERFRVELLPKLQSKLSRENDVIMTTKGWSTGRTSFVLAEHPQTVYSPHISYWRSLRPDILDPKYLRQWARGPQFLRQLETLAGTCTLHPYLNLSSQFQLEIEVPPIREQYGASEILGALDDKIELNRKMNRTLEEMAQALFKSWFIDFDGHKDLVDSELGPIPNGWKVGSLGDLLELCRGFDLPKNSRLVGTVPIISSSGHSGWHNEIKVEGPGVVVGRYGTIGQVFYVDEGYWPLNTSLYVRDFKGCPPRWIFHVLGTINWDAYTGKSAVPGVNRNHLHKERLVQPPIEERRRFAEVVNPLWDRHTANLRESDTLAELRDTLLPKLISGELRIPEAEALVP